MKKVYLDVAENNQLYFQEPASTLMMNIKDFHDNLMYILIVIFSIVAYWLIQLINKNSINNKIKLKYHNHNSTVEFIWTIIPALILVIIAIPSFKLLYSLDEIEKPQITLKVKGNQWFWNYEISDIDNTNIAFDSYTINDEDLELGQLRLLDVDNRVYLPILTPIRILLTSEDVVHSFAVPSLGIKLDTVPGRINAISTMLLRKGTFYGQCSELCGLQHYKMSIVIQGVSKNEYIDWLLNQI